MTNEPNSIERSVIRRVHTDIRGDMEKTHAIVVPGDPRLHYDVKSLPPLGDERMRYDRMGKIWIRRFKGANNIQVPLPEFEGHIGINKATIEESQWAKFSDVESAIRGTRHIADSYDKKVGRETVSILGVHNLMKTVSRELQKPKTDRKSFEEIEADIATGIIQNGFDNVKTAEKRIIKDKLLAAVSKDKLGRENPARTRMLIAHLYPDITRALLGNEFAHNKYRYLEGVLMGQRERDRFPFGHLVESTKRLELVTERDVEVKRIIGGIRQSVFTELSPRQIHVAPYVQLAAETRFALLDRDTDIGVETLKKYTDEDVERYRSIPSFRELTPSERIERIKEVGKSVQQELLERDDFLPLPIAA